MEYFASMGISEVFDTLAKYPWSANSCLYAGPDKFTSAPHGRVISLVFSVNV